MGQMKSSSKKHILQNELGMTLIGVMVAAAIMGGLMVAFMKFTSYQARQQTYRTLMSAMPGNKAQLEGIFWRKEDCTQTLVSNGGITLGQTFTGITDRQDRSLFQEDDSNNRAYWYIDEISVVNEGDSDKYGCEYTGSGALFAVENCPKAGIIQQSNDSSLTPYMEVSLRVKWLVGFPGGGTQNLGGVTTVWQTINAIKLSNPIKYSVDPAWLTSAPMDYDSAEDDYNDWVEKCNTHDDVTFGVLDTQRSSIKPVNDGLYVPYVQCYYHPTGTVFLTCIDS
jgi:hypothetical protein